jgi:hypothetical protein
MASSAKEKAAVDIKAALEAFAGHAIDATRQQIEEQLRFFIVPFSSYSFTPPAGGGVTTDNVGQVVSRSIIVFRSNICTPSELLDVSGASVTPASGHLTLLITSFLCPNEETRIYSEPVNIVATAASSTPAYITATHTLIVTPPNTVATNVQLDIFSWDATGAPAGDVAVNWRCRVPTAPLIIIQ